MRAFYIAAASLTFAALAGCAIKPQVVSSSPRTVVIKAGDLFVQESQDLADQECRKHERYARLIEKPNPNSDQFVYDCVR
ncbi:hypothetical protein [Comamonas testosteroni]|nr:hypothetical protein [Comamonas testosteroni]